MVLFDVPDIRLFWSEDSRFINQFEDGKIVKFKPFSSKPTCYKDIRFVISKQLFLGRGFLAHHLSLYSRPTSFWVPPEYHENNFYELVRTVAGDIVEDVSLVDKFTHPKKGQTSYCYRLNYRAMDRTLTNDEINVLQEKVKAACVSDLAVQLR
jgi:phenylalanyl-tRNA synthetase alpha chain